MTGWGGWTDDMLEGPDGEPVDPVGAIIHSLVGRIREWRRRRRSR